MLTAVLSHRSTPVAGGLLLGLAGLLGLLVWQAGAPGAIAGATVAGTVALERRKARQAAASAHSAAGEVTAVETLGLELRCGAAPLAALRAAAAAVHADAQAGAQPVAAVLDAAGRAASLSSAAARLDSGSPGLRALGQAVRLTEETGSSLATLCDALATPLRDRQVADRELRDALAGVRSSADLLTGLPLLGLLLAAGLGARPLSVLLHTQPGAVCLDLGVGLGSLGRWWTGRLIDRARLAGQA